MNIIYIDILSVFSLLAIIRSRIAYSHIFYFNTTSKGKRFAKVVMSLGLLKVVPQEAEFQLSEITDEKGNCQSFKITDNIKDICFEISDKEFDNNRFLKRFSNHFDFKRIVFFLRKVLAYEINDIVVFINVAKWHVDNKVSLTNKSVFFFMEKSLWHRYLSQYVTRLNMKPVKYRSMINSIYLTYLSKGKKFMLAKIKDKLKRLQNVNLNINQRCNEKHGYFPHSKSVLSEGRKEDSHNTDLRTNKSIKKKGDNQLKATDGKASYIAITCTGKTVTFDLKKRSDFFWLLKSGISHEKVIACFERINTPLTGEKAKILENEGVKSIALSHIALDTENGHVWCSGVKYKLLKEYFVLNVIKEYFWCVVKLQFVPLFYLKNMFYFVLKYSFWYDFFYSNNVKVHISYSDFEKHYAPKILALEKSGGVNVSCQWSNIDFSSIIINSCTHVLFSFGSAYKWMWESNRSSIDYLVYSGYITDYSFAAVKADALKVREQLLNKGIKFIICFFDENSSNDRMTDVTNKRSVDTYRYFINKVLEDNTLGLIFKPGYPSTLPKRLSEIANLIEDAKRTGRCMFMDGGDYVTDQYPAEAAQASDLCVGLLLSGTAVLESYLSGTPTVFLDLERFLSNPIYKLGKDKVVFDNLDKLFLVIKQYRKDPQSVPGFGDLSTWVRDRDTFKDGNASLRIGQYIKWLFEKLEEGNGREEAIEYANRKYAALWGSENVVKWH